MTAAIPADTKDSSGLIRIAVQALIYSESLSPAEISACLGLQPTTTADKGFKFGWKTGTAVNVPRHMWQLSSEPNVEVLEFGSHLDWLLSRLLPVRDQLRSLHDSGVIDCELIGVIWTSGSSAHLKLSSSQTKTLSSLQLEIQFEFADYGEDD